MNNSGQKYWVRGFGSLPVQFLSIVEITAALDQCVSNKDRLEIISGQYNNEILPDEIRHKQPYTHGLCAVTCNQVRKG